MNKLLLSGLACATLAIGSAGSLYAHGGQYRGPGDVVPPNPGGGGAPSTPRPGGPSTPGPGGPSTPGPTGPSTPGPSGPTTGGPSNPGSQRAATTGPRGIELSDDLTKWQFWWEFNKDPFIRLKEALAASGTITSSEEVYLGPSNRNEVKNTLRPSDTDKRDTILPALKRAIDGTDNRDITSSCLVAMAKIGMDHDSFKILPEFKKRLVSSDQEIRETAALAMGISQMPAAIGDLVHLVKDTADGRKLVNRSEVDDRTRTFAAYALGLVAHNTSDIDSKVQVFEALREVLADERASISRNLKVGVINGIRLLQPQPKGSEATEKTTTLTNNAIEALMAYYGKKVGQGEQLIQAHVPPAIATLLGRDGDTTGKFKEMFAKELTTAGRSDSIYQSAILALGTLASNPEEKKDGKSDEKYSKALQDYWKDGKDAQARYFSLISLAQIGGNDNRNFLLTQLDKGMKGLERPWAAIALGVFAHNKHEADGRNASVDKTIGEALRKQLDNKNPDTLAAVAIARGLAQYKDAAGTITELLIKNKSQDELAGYLCISLALMGETRAIGDIKSLVQESVRRPDRLRQAAIALGKLGDREVATILQGILSEDDSNLGKLSAVASALGFIGDRRSIEPLTKMLFSESITPLSRAFAAVALGGIADKEPLPWNSKIAVNINYRASVETLTNGSVGILDIL